MTVQKAGIGRITAAIVAIAAMLPYLTLKVLWMTGSSLGISDPSFMNDSALFGLNAMTFGMDFTGLLLCLAFSMRWGMRLPAWLVLLPIWVGTGLLAAILVTLPLGVLIEGASLFSTGGPIAPWVYMLVYGGFVGQGIGLIVAFVLYARDRWPFAFLGYGTAGVTRGFQQVIAWGSLVVTLVVGGARLSWTFSEPVAGALQDGFKGIVAIAGGICLVALVRGRPYWLSLVVAWIGSGTLFAWGLYAQILQAVGGPLSAGPAMPALSLVELFGMLTGLVMAMGGAFHLVERSAAVSDVQAAQQPLEGEDGERDRHPAHHGHR